MVGLSGHQVVNHIHRGGKQHLDAGLGGGIRNGFSQKAFTHTGVSYQDNVFFVANKIQVQQLQDFSFLFFAGDMEVEVKLIDGGFFQKL